MNKKVLDKKDNFAYNSLDSRQQTADSRQQTAISVNCTNSLKGIFAIGVLIHHLYLCSGLFRETVIGSCLQITGVLSVAIFFFISGYGLYSSCHYKGEAYIKSFPKKRIVPFYFLILFYLAIYMLFENFVLKEKITLANVIKSLTFGGGIISNGWYLQVQLLLYLLFFLTFYIIKKNQARITLILCECLLIAILTYAYGYLSTSYETIFAFPMGMIWFEIYPNIKRYFQKKKYMILYISIEFIIFFVCLISSKLLKNIIVALILKMISSVLFTILVATSINLFNVENKITKWLGKYSTEIYIIQGLFLGLFHSEFINISNPYLYALIVTLFVLLSSIILHPITVKIYSIARR
jgi:peptidoglycan/LPS O-acetylase OafA/YrhL